ATFPEADESAIETALTKAWDVRHGWRDGGVAMRASLMRSVAGVLRADKSRYAALATVEMGKPIVEAEAEVEKCAWTANWFAENAERLLADQTIESTASESYVRFQPLGVVMAVMPWNFPFWQAFRAGLPALSAGNVMLLKHSSNVPQSALAIEEVFREAGVPEGVFQTLLIGSAAVEGLIADHRVAGVSLSGSEKGGVAALKLGTPMERQHQVGPPARAALAGELERQVRESIRRGARPLVGGNRIQGDGYYYEPTVLTNVRPGMPAYHEETFGPVAAVIRVRDADDALRVANDTDFGLGSNIWTSDIERGKKLAEKVEAGLVFINGMVASDARLPFGGVKRSGYGRELSDYAIKEFTHIQTVCVGPAAVPAQGASPG